MIDIYDLRDEACLEAYKYFDKNIRPLPKNADGSFKVTLEYIDSDIDAFRHAYVSGVYVQEYGELIADLLGRINEFGSFASDSRGGEASKNMDLWNNAVGRRYGTAIRSRQN